MATRLQNFKKSTSSNPKDKLQKQVDNYKTRLSSINKSDTADTRNWFEKWANLEKDQNVLFDIFELIGRPQQALYGAIDSAKNDENILEGAWEGFKGDKKLTGKELLTDDFGWEDSDFNLLDVSSWKDIKPSDLVGITSDIFLDPMDLALFGVTAATGGAAAPALAAKVAGDTVQIVDTAADIGKGVQKVNKAANILDTASDVAKTKYTFAPFQKGSVSANDILFRTAGKKIKGAAGITDKGIEKVLKKLDDINRNKIMKYADDYGLSFEKAASELRKGTEKLDTYKALKQGVNRTIDNSKLLNGFVGKSKSIDNLSDLERKWGEELVGSVSNKVRKYASKYGDNADNVYKEVMNELSNAIESQADWTLRGKDVVKQFSKSKTAEFFTPEQATAVQNLLRKYNIDSTIGKNGHTLILDSDIKKLYTIQDTIKDVKLGQKMDNEVRKILDDTYDKFMKDPELKEIYQEASKSVKKATQFSDKLKGTTSADMATEDYVKHNLSKDVRRSDSKVYKERKYDAPIEQVDRMKDPDVEVLEATTKAKRQKAQSDIYEMNDDGTIKMDKDNKPIRNDNYYKTAVNNKGKYIEKLEAEKISSEELLKLKKGDVTFDKSKLTKSGERNYKLIKEVDSLEKQLDEFNNIKWNVIDPENAEIIKKAGDARNECYKAFTKYKNTLKKKTATDEAINEAYEVLNIKKKQLTATLLEAKNYANKKSKGIIKKANESVKMTLKGAFEEGKTYQQLYDKKGRLTVARQEAYETAADMVENLNKKIEYEKASFEKLKGAKDDIFRKKLRIIDECSKTLETINNDTAREFFVRSFEENLTEFINRNAAYTAGAKKVNEALVDGIFENPDYVKFEDDLVDGKIPNNFEKISGDFFKNSLEGFKHILPDDSKALMGVLDDFTGKTLYVDKDLLKIFKLSKEATTQQLKPLLKVIDGMNNFMKKFSTLTLGFQVRNIVGNATNMVLSGMPASKLPEYYKKAANLWNKSDELLQKFVNNTLTDLDKEDWKILQQFYEGGFSDAFTRGQALEEVAKGGKSPFAKLSKASVNTNNLVDRYNRLALLLYANDVPEYVTKLGRKTPIGAVKFALFDPTNLSDFERNAMKRLIPFYTFTKQNLLFQADNIMRNTPRYNKLFKSLNAMYNDLDEDNYFAYQKNNMQIPLPWADDNGNQMFLKANLPVSDLGEFLSDPKRRILSSVSPLIKAPIEATTGKSLYTGEDLYYNTISKGLQKIGIDSPGIANIADGVEAILNNFGLQNVTTNLYKKLSAIISGINEESDPQQVWAEILRSIVQNTNEENVELSKLYDELEVYQDAVKQLKNQGIDVPEIKEITSSNNIKLNNMKRKRASLK